MSKITIDIDPEELMEFVIWLDTEIITSQPELPADHIAWLTKVADAISKSVSELAGYEHIKLEDAIKA
jgi:hypothetical protein